MDFILVVLTVLAFAAAGIFAMAAWKARAEAEQRSAARVAALASALASDPGSGIRDQGSGTTEPGTLERPDPGSPSPDPQSMFASATADGRPLTKPAIATAVAALILIAGGTALRNDAHPAAAPAETAALELVSMRHARQGRTLTVTGLVRNPPAGAALSGVAALVFAFDRGGEFVASGRAALELPVLQPGEEAPFAVTVTDLADVGRYRVSFRTPAGPLRHVDRRTARQLVKVQ